MSKYTNSEIRAAILRAADRIERNPSLYDFSEIYVATDCGSPFCMLGWVGYELGSKALTSHAVAMELSGVFCNALDNDYAMAFYAFCERVAPQYMWDEKQAARAMRLYADHKFPADASGDFTPGEWDLIPWKPKRERV